MWASGGKRSIDKAPLDALAAFGATSEQLAEAEADLQARRDAESLPIWADHWDAVQIFAAVGTQWRVVMGMASAHWLGIDYNVLPTVLRLHRIPRDEWRQVFECIRQMEAGALQVLNARQG